VINCLVVVVVNVSEILSEANFRENAVDKVL